MTKKKAKAEAENTPDLPIEDMVERLWQSALKHGWDLSDSGPPDETPAP